MFKNFIPIIYTDDQNKYDYLDVTSIIILSTYIK